QRATPVALLLGRPVEPCAEQAPESCGPGRLAQRRQDHTRAEVLYDALEHGELEGLLGAEVREQTALREARPLGEPADREPLETVDARDRYGVAENGCARDFAFDHWAVSYERSFFFVNSARRRSRTDGSGIMAPFLSCSSGPAFQMRTL